MTVFFQQFYPGAPFEDTEAREAIVILEGEQVAQAEEIAELSKGAQGAIVSSNAIPPADLFTVAVPPATLALIPFTGLGVISEPPDIWVESAGVVIGSNDIDSRMIWTLNARVRDTGGGQVLWQFGLVRGENLTSSPVFAERSLLMPTNLRNGLEPAAVTVVTQFTNPTSGQAFEYGIVALHGAVQARTLGVQALTFIGETIGPGTV